MHPSTQEPPRRRSAAPTFRQRANLVPSGVRFRQFPPGLLRPRKQFVVARPRLLRRALRHLPNQFPRPTKRTVLASCRAPRFSGSTHPSLGYKLATYDEERRSAGDRRACRLPCALRYDERPSASISLQYIRILLHIAKRGGPFMRKIILASAVALGVATMTTSALAADSAATVRGRRADCRDRSDVPRRRRS